MALRYLSRKLTVPAAATRALRRASAPCVSPPVTGGSRLLASLSSQKEAARRASGEGTPYRSFRQLERDWDELEKLTNLTSKKLLLRLRLRPGDKKRDAEIHNLKRLVLCMDTLIKSAATSRKEAAANSKKMLRHVVMLPCTLTLVLFVVYFCMCYVFITVIFTNMLKIMSSKLLDMVDEVINEFRGKCGLDDEKLEYMIQALAKKFEETIRGFVYAKFEEEIPRYIKDKVKFW